MGDNATIRLATMRDYAAICRLGEQVDQCHVELLPDVFQPYPGPSRTREVVAAYVEEPDADYILAEMHGLVVGALNIRKASHPAYPMFRPHDYALIETLVVDETCRRRGIGTMLLDAAHRWAKEHGLPTIQLTVWAANAPALAFYTRHGFVVKTWQMELCHDAE